MLLERVFGVGLFLLLPFMVPASTLGHYYEIIALLTLCTGVGLLGLDVGVTRFTALAAERGAFGDIRAYLRAGIVAAAVSGAILAMGLYALAPSLSRVFGEAGFASSVRIGALAVPVLILAYVLVAPGRGLKSMWPAVATIQIAQPGVQLLATVGLVAAGYGLGGAVGAFTVSAAASLAIGVWFLRRLKLPLSAERPPSVTAALLKFSAPVSGMTLMGTTLLWVDTLLLGAFRPAAEVATYGIVVRLMAFSTALTIAVVQIFGPFVTQLVARDDRPELERVLRTATRWVLGLAGPALVLLMLGARPLLAVFRQSAPGGVAATVILGAAFVMDCATAPLVQLLTMSGRPALNFANTAVAVAANVGLNLVLIPHLGLVGAAVSWAAAIGCLAVARVIEVRVLFRANPFGSGVVALCAGLVASALAGLAFLRLTARWELPAVAAVAALAAVVFGLFALAMRWHGLDEDRVLLRALLARRPPG